MVAAFACQYSISIFKYNGNFVSNHVYKNSEVPITAAFPTSQIDNFVEIYYEIFSAVILSLPLI